MVRGARLLLICGIVSFPAAGQAQLGDGDFQHISITEGLSDSHLRSIVQDRRGFLWFGTFDGLNRYDGYQIRVFRYEPGNPRSLASNFVRALYVDRSGTLWVGTIGGGLHRFDPLSEGFVRYQHDPNDRESLGDNRVRSICEDPSGGLWIATAKGLDRLDRYSGRFRHYRHDPGDPDSLSHDDVYSVLPDRSGAIWVGTYGGGLNKLVSSPGPARFIHYRHDPKDAHSLSSDLVHTLYEDKEGLLWIGTWGGGLNRFDPDQGSFKRYENRGLSGNLIWSVQEDRQGRLWVGAWGGGLSQFDRRTESFKTYRHDPAEPRSLAHDNVVSIYEDREGLLWVGTGGGGVSRLDPARRPFATLSFDSSGRRAATSRDVRAVQEDREGSLWIGTFSDGLYAVDEKSHRVHNYRHDPESPRSLSSDSVSSIAEGQRGALWVGTSGGLNRLERVTGRFRRYNHDPSEPTSLSDDTVSSLLAEQDTGVVWVGTSRGLNRLDPRTDTFTRYARGSTGEPGSGSDEVAVVFKDRKGALWLGRPDGLDRLDTATGQFQHYRLDSGPGSSETAVLAIHQDARGWLWLGGTTGLLQFDPDTGSVIRYTEAPDAPHGMVWAILEDAEGRLWLSTPQGLLRFDPGTKQFRHYDWSELPLRQTFGQGACQGRTGKLFFGAGDGLLAFDPSQIKDLPYAPPVVLTGFQIANRPVPIAEDSVLKQSITETAALTLLPSDGIVSFEFAALSYRAPARNRYRYRLEGFDREWTEVDSQRRLVTYTNLAPGNYLFRVLGSNNDGFWNEEGAALRITVLPFWWQTWWFRWGSLAGAALLLFAAHRVRLRFVEARAAEVRAVLESLRSHIAVLDGKGRITAVNESWSSFARDEASGAAPGANYLDVCRRAVEEGAEKAEEALSGIESVLLGKADLFELEYARRNSSSTLWYSLTVMPFRGAAGGAVVSYTDVTAHKRAEEEAQRHREELAHVTRVATVGELAASIAHEINQPLASIVTNANAGRRFLEGDGSDTGEIRSVLRDIAEQGKRAGEIIRRLRELLKKGRVDRKSLDVNELIRGVAALVRSDALTKRISMRLSLAGGLPGVPGDPIQLQQVILNLMMNSFEAMSQGEAGPCELTVRTWSDDRETVEVALSDTGPPISEETFQKMFMRFYTTKPAGLGIGLSISRSIVEAHGGRLWAERNPERGLTMRLTLATAEQGVAALQEQAAAAPADP